MHRRFKEQHIALARKRCRFLRKQFIFQLRDAVLCRAKLLLLPCRSVGSLQRLCGKKRGDFTVLVIDGAQIGKCLPAAEQLDARACMKTRDGEQLDKPDLSCPRDVQPTSGASVEVGEADDAHRAGQRLFAAVRQDGESVRVRVEYLCFDVFPNRLICGKLDLF